MNLRILFLQHPGANSRDIFFDIIEGYREAGNEVFVLELGPLWARMRVCARPEDKDACVKLFADTVLGFARANRIDLCVTMWANGHISLGSRGEESFFEHAGLPILMHWLDAPQWAHRGEVLDLPPSLLNGPNTFHAINNPETAKEMDRVLGFSNVIALSNAAGPTSFRPYPDEKKDFDIVFGVGADRSQPTDLMRREQAEDAPDVHAIRAAAAAALRPELCEITAPVWDRSAGADRFVDLLIQARLKCRDEAVLNQVGRIVREHRDMAPAVLSLLQDARRYVQFSMTLRRMEEWERAFVFVYLSRYFRCATFGLEESFKNWPGTWEHLGPLPHEEQARAYSRSRFGLNVMRWQDDVGLNLKPFEITLSGACLLQSYRVGIEALFDESQIVVFRTPQECRAKVAELLAKAQRIAQMAAAGRARALAQHCWKHRAAEVTGALTKGRACAAEVSTGSGPEDEEGGELVFLLGLWRSGITLLRRMLDSHTEIHAPAETWFLPPLLDLWEGKERGGDLQAGQAAALRRHVGFDQFLACCRAFAARFYRTTMPPNARYFVDKTPFYVKLAGVLPQLFPRAKFLVLSRDPRGTVWSQHTWKHIESPSAEAHFADVADGNRVLYRFLQNHPDRSLHVQYERLCIEATTELRSVCQFLDLPVEPGMVEYGNLPHHEGYGDEKTRLHDRAHTGALKRWAAEEGLSLDQQIQLAAACGNEVLIRLGYPELASLAAGREEPAGVR